MNNKEIIAELSEEKKENVVHLVFNPDCSKGKGIEMMFMSDVKLLLGKARAEGRKEMSTLAEIESLKLQLETKNLSEIALSEKITDWQRECVNRDVIISEKDKELLDQKVKITHLESILQFERKMLDDYKKAVKAAEFVIRNYKDGLGKLKE